MLELTQVRKNKISLLDYDYKKDIDNRSLLSTFSKFELEVLEEILYSSVKTSVSRLSKNLDVSEKKLMPILEKLSTTNLLQIEQEIIFIDKKTRKYFEFEFSRFDDDFKPDMLFIQGLLHKIPIHILPIWYSLPRASNNIFNSIIDRYLLTPQMYQRYLDEIENENDIFKEIITKLRNSTNFEINSKDIQQKFNLAREDFLEHILLLEFNFVCYLTYKVENNVLVEKIVFFHEYKEYKHHLKNTEVKTIPSNSISRKRNTDFGFVEDISSILLMAKKNFSLKETKENLAKELNLKDPDIHVNSAYINSVVNKLLQIKFIEKKNDKLYLSESAKDWMTMDFGKKALHLYHHSLNHIVNKDIPNTLLTEKKIREAEKSILRILHIGWVYFEDFVKSFLVSFDTDNSVKLKKFGKIYKYNIPVYTQEEVLFIKTVVFERLFETGIVAIGSIKQKDCLMVTEFGRSLFDF